MAIPELLEVPIIPKRNLSRRFIFFVLLFVLAYFFFRLSFQVGFLSDDHFLLTFAHFSPLHLSIFSVRADGWSPFFRPVGLLAWKAQYAIFGDTISGYRFLSLLIHAANGLLVAILARYVEPQSRVFSYISGILFIILPVQVETVVWIAAVYERLVLLFLLSALILLLVHWQHRGAWLYLAAFGSFQLALWSKETAFVFPALVVMLWLFTAHRPTLPKLLVELVPFVLLLCINLAQRYLAWGSIGGYPISNSAQLTDNFAHLISALSMLLVPISVDLLSINFRVILLIGMICIFILGILVSHKRSIFVIGAGWVLLTLLPALASLDPSLLNSYLIDSRYLYVPAAGYSLALAAALIGTGERVYGLVYQATANRRIITFCLNGFGLGILTFLVVGLWLAVQAQIRPWITATHLSEQIIKEIHEVFPQPQLFSELCVDNYPLLYKGAYVYWFGLDAALLNKYGTLFNWVQGGEDAPIPYDGGRLPEDFYQVVMGERRDGREMYIKKARAITTGEQNIHLPDGHWLTKMGADNAALSTVQSQPFTPVYDYTYDLHACPSGLGAWSLDSQAPCVPGLGYRLGPPPDGHSLISPSLKIITDRWVEVIVTLTTLEDTQSPGFLKLSWRGPQGGEWHSQRIAAIALPPAASSLTFHFYIPPISANRSLDRLKLQSLETGTSLYIHSVSLILH